jgi:hypothetical protein
MEKNNDPPQRDASNPNHRKKSLMVNKKDCVKFKKKDASSTKFNHDKRQVLHSITNNPLFIESQKNFESIQNQYSFNFNKQSETSRKQSASHDTETPLPQFNTETQNENTQQTVKLNQHGLPSNTSKKIDVTLKNKTIPALNLKGPTILQQQNVIHSVTSNSLPNTKNAANTKSRPAPANPITPTFITGFGSQSFPKKMMSTISNTYPDLYSQ